MTEQADVHLAMRMDVFVGYAVPQGQKRSGAPDAETHRRQDTDRTAVVKDHWHGAIPVHAIGQLGRRAPAWQMAR